MDNYFIDMGFVDALITFFAASTCLCAFLAIVVAVTDWLQAKLDEFNDEQDRQQQEQLNNQEQ